MASEHLKKNFKLSALSLALGCCFIGGVQAQTNTAGAVSGSAQAGDTSTSSNPNTGFSRTITVGADGSYRFSQVPIGQYTVTRNGSSPRNVTVNVGTAANVSYGAPGGAQHLHAVALHDLSRAANVLQPACEVADDVLREIGVEEHLAPGDEVVVLPHLRGRGL